jgi:hypothetical protein
VTIPERPSVAWFLCRSARRDHVDDDAALSRDIDAMGGVVGRHNQGLTIDSDGPDDASGPSSKLARVLSAKADELAGNGFCAPPGGPEHGLEAIEYFLGPRVTCDYWAMFAVAWPGVELRAVDATGGGCRIRVISLGTAKASAGPGPDVRSNVCCPASIGLASRSAWPICGPRGAHRCAHSSGACEPITAPALAARWSAPAVVRTSRGLPAGRSVVARHQRAER